MKVCWLNICRETSSGINISTETCCARSFIAWATVFEQLDQYLCPKWRKLSFFFGFVYNGKRILSKFPEFTAANTPTPKVNSPSHRAKLHLCFNLANNRLTTSNNHIASLADVTKLNQQPLESNENKQTRKHFLKFSSDITSAPSADLNRCSSAWKHTLNFVLVKITNSSYKSEKTMSKIVSVLSKYKHKCKHLVIRLLN